MLAEANTPAKRSEWIRVVGRIKELKPIYVISGYCQAEEIMGTWYLANTKQYIVDFGRVLETAKDRKDIIASMNKLYPDRLNPAALITSAARALKAPKDARI